MRAGMEPLINDGYMAFPPIRVIGSSNYIVLVQTFSRLSGETRDVFVLLPVDGSIAPKGHPVIRLGITDSCIPDKVFRDFHQC